MRIGFLSEYSVGFTVSRISVQVVTTDTSCVNFKMLLKIESQLALK